MARDATVGVLTTIDQLKSRRQLTLSRSNTEAEYRGVANVVAETCHAHSKDVATATTSPKATSRGNARSQVRMLTFDEQLRSINIESKKKTASVSQFVEGELLQSRHERMTSDAFYFQKAIEYHEWLLQQEAQPRLTVPRSSVTVKMPVSWQGANNDINVLDNSPLFDDLLDDLALVVPYVVNGVEYRNGYYLEDGIYPEWASFVKSFTVATDPKHNSVKKVHGKMSNMLSVFSKDVGDLFNNRPVHTKSTHYVESSLDGDGEKRMATTMVDLCWPVVVVYGEGSSNREDMVDAKNQQPLSLSPPATMTTNQEAVETLLSQGFITKTDKNGVYAHGVLGMEGREGSETGGEVSSVYGCVWKQAKWSILEQEGKGRKRANDNITIIELQEDEIKELQEDEMKELQEDEIKDDVNCRNDKNIEELNGLKIHEDANGNSYNYVDLYVEDVETGKVYSVLNLIAELSIRTMDELTKLTVNAVVDLIPTAIRNTLGNPYRISPFYNASKGPIKTKTAPPPALPQSLFRFKESKQLVYTVNHSDKSGYLVDEKLWAPIYKNNSEPISFQNAISEGIVSKVVAYGIAKVYEFYQSIG
nr:hypothetical protein [Tanacetum cinerariifolium]